MDKHFDLSIIIPCHYSGKIIPPLLYSLRKQKIYGYNVELLFIKDEKEDNTNDLIITYMKGTCYRTNIIEISPCLQAQARNYGIDNACGDYIMFIDSDDWLIDDYAISKLLSLIKSKDLKVLKFGYDYPSNFTAESCNSVVWQYIYNREFIGDIRFPEQRYDEDVVFLQRFFEKYVREMNSKQLELLNEKLYYYNFGRFDSVMTNRLFGRDKT